MASFDEGRSAPGCDTDEPTPNSEFLISCLVLVATLAFVEVFYRSSPIELQVRKGSTVGAKALEYATLGGDIVTTGNSRMYHAVRPAVIQQSLERVKGTRYTTYNFGIPSAYSPMYLVVAKEAARHRPVPKLFVLGISPVLSTCCDEVAFAGTRLGMTWPVVPNFLRAAWWSNTDDAGFAVFLGASRLLQQRDDFLSALHELRAPTALTFHDRGYLSMGGRVDPETQDIRARGRAVGYADAMDKAKGGAIRITSLRYFAEAVRVLQNAGIGVVVIGAPQARQLDWYHDANHNFPEYYAAMKELSERFGVPFIDLNNPPGVANSDFVDGDHLSEPGAEIFSRYLAENVIAPHLP